MARYDIQQAFVVQLLHFVELKSSVSLSGEGGMPSEPTGDNRGPNPESALNCVKSRAQTKRGVKLR